MVVHEGSSVGTQRVVWWYMKGHLLVYKGLCSGI